MRGHREDGSSLSSASVGSNSSGQQSLSGLSSASSSLSAASSTLMSTSPSSSSQLGMGNMGMGFLDELKQLAERRSSHSDSLLTDTLNKTRTGQGSKVVGKLVPKHASDEKRRQHGKKQQ